MIIYRVKIRKGRIEGLDKAYISRLTLKTGILMVGISTNTALLWRRRMQLADWRGTKDVAPKSLRKVHIDRNT